MKNVSIPIHKLTGVPELAMDTRPSGIALYIHDSADPEFCRSDDITLLVDGRHSERLARAVAAFNKEMLRADAAPVDLREVA
jgi:hypothetical protein